jgi:hypothetical protein
MEGLTELNSLSISWNKSLKNFSGLDSLVEIHSSFRVNFNDSLSSLEGLGSLSNLGYFIEFFRNKSLENFTGLETISFVGSFDILENESLQSLTGLEDLTEIPGSITIKRNPKLTSLSGLNNFKKAGNIYIEENHALVDIMALSSLDSVRGSFRLDDNSSLPNLDGLENLKFVAESTLSELYIGFNDDLTDISALDHPLTIQGNLALHYNNSLSSCAVQAVCDYLENPPGTSYISNNVFGCNSPAEIKEACGIVGATSGTEPKRQFILAPNPNNGHFTVNNLLLLEGKLNVQNIAGHKIFEQKLENVNLIDLSDQPAGLFVITIVTKNETYLEKVIKYD